MKIPFVEFYPFTFVTKEQNSVAEYSPILKLPDLVQLRNYKAIPPFRSLVPRPPPFFVLRFSFSIIHGSGRARKTGKAWEHLSRE